MMLAESNESIFDVKIDISRDPPREKLKVFWGSLPLHRLGQNSAYRKHISVIVARLTCSLQVLRHVIVRTPYTMQM